jgi:hypothetical protein
MQLTLQREVIEKGGTFATVLALNLTIFLLIGTALAYAVLAECPTNPDVQFLKVQDSTGLSESN